MRCLTVLTGVLVLAGIGSVRAETPITPGERAVVVQMTRLRGVRLWWNEDNRVVGAAIKGVNAADDTVRLVSQLPMLRSLVLVAVADHRLTDKSLDTLRDMSRLELLYLVGTDVTDRGAKNLLALKNLRALVLKGKFSDSTLAVVAQLPNLEFLDLTQTQISDEGLAALSKLPKLQTLILNGTSITSQGLAPIAHIKTLRWLYLGDTPIDDAAVVHLRQLSNLDELFVRGTKITRAGIQTLQAAMDSGCAIFHNSGATRGTRAEPPGLAVTALR